MNFFLYFLIVTLIISQKIFLLNEEFLILLCFISFLFLVFDKLKTNLNDFFKLETNQIESNLKKSFNNFLKILEDKKNWNTKLLKIKIYFNFLKIYYLNINLINSEKIIKLQNFKKKSNFKLKLLFINNYEKQISKLLVILLLKKINKISHINYFFKNSFKLTKFNTFNKICLKEYLNNI
uniref:ATP synthase F0 subunit b n=1 Tax=Griffithsia okiensis TaxID=291168 RepID=UPI002E75B3D6|nr:ATP synthase F0 subunit b [Griffithsia okiensis]WQF69533.1 ATP synthase F0 subunit b [Griffithsia okiensis]